MNVVIRLLFPGLIVSLLLAACTRPKTADPDFGYLAETLQRSSVAHVSRPVLPEAETWTSAWFEAQANIRIEGWYGIVQDRIPETQSADVERDEQGEKDRAAPNGKGIKQQLTALGVEVPHRRLATGHVVFNVSLESEHGPRKECLNEVLELTEGGEAAHWQPYAGEAPAPTGGRWRLICRQQAPQGKGLRGVFATPYWFRSAPDRPNKGLILISIDTLRADHVGAFGYPRAVTANLDRWSQSCVLYSAIRSTSSWTLPAHMSLFTGLAPAGHRVRSARDVPLEAAIPLFTQHFAERGWRTAAFTGGAYLSPQWGIDRGFELFDYADNDAVNAFAHARQWLESVKGQPFFAFIHFYDVHLPYNRHNPSPILARPELDSSGLTHTKSHLSLEDLISLYDDGLRHVDGELGRFLNFLCDRGLYETTALAVVSDHGEELADHQGYLHGHTLYEELLRIPLLVHAPANHRRAVKVTEGSISDTFPLLCAAAGLPLPPIAANDDATSTGHVMVAEISDTTRVLASIGAETKAVVTENQEMEVYDLAQDPQERSPLAADGLQPRAWLPLLANLVQSNSGQQQLWFFHPHEMIRGELSSTSGLQPPRLILARLDSFVQTAADTWEFRLQPHTTAPFCGMLLEGAGLVLRNVRIGGDPIPPDLMLSGCRLLAPHIVGAGIALGQVREDAPPPAWVFSLTSKLAAGSRVLELQPLQARLSQPAPVMDEDVRERLRHLGYIE